MTVRKWQQDDAEAICEIYNLITSKDINSDFKRKVLLHSKEAGSESHFIAEIEGKIAGFVISYILPFGFGSDDCGYIATMGVHPDYMGQGLGSRMLHKLCDYYRGKGVSRVCTSVKWDSTDILSFFSTQGFERSNFLNLYQKL